MSAMGEPAVTRTPAMTKGGRKRILMSAFACEPGLGSEPGVGWNWAVQAARFHDVWVLTAGEHRAGIEKALAECPIPGLHVVYHDAVWARRWLRRGTKGYLPYYLVWQQSVVATARALHRRIGFDIVHHVTYNAIDFPGLLWRLDAPFVWGPVGGAQEPDPALKGYFGRGWWLEQLRILRKRLLVFNPLLRLGVRRAACILVANRDTERLLQRLGATHVLRELETAVHLPVVTRDTSRPENATLAVVWAGRLVARKAPLLALDVVAELKRRGTPVHMTMAGDGPWRRRLADQVVKRGLEQNVTILGRVPYTEMSDLYRDGDVFLFSSLHDTSGNVLLEAMAHSVPIVTLDQHGAADIVTPACGIRVPIRDARQVVDDLASALSELAVNHEKRRSLSEGARCRAATVYNWDCKGELMRELYQSISRGCSVER